MNNINFKLTMIQFASISFISLSAVLLFYDFKPIGILLASIGLFFAIYFYFYVKKTIKRCERGMEESLKELKRQTGININPDLTHREKK